MHVWVGRSGGWSALLLGGMFAFLSCQSADSVPVGVGDVGLPLKVCEHGARLEVVPEAPHAARCPLLYHLVLSKELQCSTLNQQLEAGVGGVSLSSCL